MGIYVKLYQDIFFKSFDWLRGRQNIQRLKFLRQSQFWDRERLEEWQLNRLNHLLWIAREHSPFHTERLRNVKLPLKHLNEIQTLPILTKKDMRVNFQRIRCQHIPLEQCELNNTGGSTGEPSLFYQHKKSLDWAEASRCRGAEWADIYFGEKAVHMTGSPFDYKRFQKVKWKIIFFLRHYKHLSVAFVDDALLDDYYHQIMRFKPTSIWGYSSGIYLFVLFVEKNYPRSRFDFLKAVITSSEALYPEQRKRINQVFGGDKVYDHYGTREVYIASECRVRQGYHIHAEVILLEVVDKNGVQVRNGEMGRILITDLSNQAFPFIRYDIGDAGVMSDRETCQCGVRLPVLDSLEGRIADIVVLKDRKLTPPNFSGSGVFASEGIDTYQIIQESVNQLRVKIVRNAKFTDTVGDYIFTCLNKLAGQGVDIIIDYVDDIPVLPSGKRRYVVSHVSPDLL